MSEYSGGPARRTSAPSSSPRWSGVAALSLAIGFAAGAITVPLALRQAPEAPAVSPAPSKDEAAETTVPVAELQGDLAELRAENEELRRKVESLESLLALYQRSRTAPPPPVAEPAPAAEPERPAAPPAARESQATAPVESSMERERQRVVAYEPRMAELATMSREAQRRDTLKAAACSGSSVARGGRREFGLASNEDSPECKASTAAAEEAQRRFSQAMEQLRDDARRHGILPGLLDQALARYGL